MHSKSVAAAPRWGLIRVRSARSRCDNCRGAAFGIGFIRRVGDAIMVRLLCFAGLGLVLAVIASGCQSSATSPAGSASSGGTGTFKATFTRVTPDAIKAAVSKCAPDCSNLHWGTDMSEGGQGSSLLKDDTWALIQMWDDASDPRCKNRSVRATEITQPLAGADYTSGVLVAGNWKERWTVDRCGKTENYDVEYLANGGGGTYMTLPAPAKDVVSR
jgi:hypothetical protein